MMTVIESQIYSRLVLNFPLRHESGWNFTFAWLNRGIKNERTRKKIHSQSIINDHNCPLTVDKKCGRIQLVYDRSIERRGSGRASIHDRPSSIKILFFNFVSVLNMMRTVFTVLVLATVAMAQRRLALPDPRSCSNRVRHATYRDARGVAHSYFFSWEHQPTRSLEVDWLDARNICRRHCMDAVSLETPQENEFIKQRLARGNVRFIWTSGRKCNFAGCDRPGKDSSFTWITNFN